MSWAQVISSDIAAIIKKLFRSVTAPLMEGGNVSIGRVMLAACFGLAMFKWAKNLDITTTHQTAFLVLCGYVLSTKAIGSVKDVIANIGETKKAVEGLKVQGGKNE